MSGNKPWKQKGRYLDHSDSGYTTPADMESVSARSSEKFSSDGDPSTFTHSGQISAMSNTAPIAINSAGSHNTPTKPRSTSSLPRSTSLVSLPQSSPFSPTKFDNHQITEFNSGVVIAGIGEAPSLDDTPQHSEEDFIGDPQFQETGGLQPSSISLPSSSVAHGGMTQILAATRLGANGTDKAGRICSAVSEYYQKQFVHQWREKTRSRGHSQGSNTMSVIAALLIEKGEDFNVVLLTAGTKIKQECTYVQGDIGESTWGLCDGHAEAVCYRLTSIYLLTEIYKLHKHKESIFELVEGKGYKLKDGIEFHLFTSHPPCGFMAKKERHYLSWKRPFITIPHNPQCSSKILINSYLGIQGPLSHLLIKPIYISSLVILRYETVPTLHDDYIDKRLQAFWEKLSAVPGLSTSTYYFCKPDVFVVDIHPNNLFPTCFTPYLHEKRNKPSCDGEPPHQESTVKQKVNPHTNKIGSAFSDVLGNAGIETLVFSIKDGIGSATDRDKMIKLRGKLFRPSPDLKQQRLKSLQDARIRLSKAINVSEALKIQDDQIMEQMKVDFAKRCEIINKTISTLRSFEKQTTDIDDLTVLVDESKTSLGKMKESELPSLQATLSSNLVNEKMHQDLQKLQKNEDPDPKINQNTYLNVMGCDWARYIETIQSDY